MQGVATIMLCIVALSGCLAAPPGDDTPPPPKPGPPSLSPSPAAGPDLPRITVVPERAQFRSGERLEITATFTNTANSTFHWTSRGCGRIQLWVDTGIRSPASSGERDEFAGMVRLWPLSGLYGCTDAEWELSIPPGGTAGETVVWDGSQRQEDETPFVGNGSYVVHADFDGAVHSIDQSWPTEGIAAVTVSDGPVPIITLHPLRDRLRPGERLPITLVFNNTSDKPYRYDAPMGGQCQYLQVWVEGRDRIVLGPESSEPGLFCTSAVTPVTIAAGERIERTVVWNGTSQGLGGRHDELPPGDYVVRADAPAPGPWDISTSVVVRILPPPR